MISWQSRMESMATNRIKNSRVDQSNVELEDLLDFTAVSSNVASRS